MVASLTFRRGGHALKPHCLCSINPYFNMFLITDQFVHERLSNVRYETGVMYLEHYMNNLEAVTLVTLKDGTKIRAPNQSRIVNEEEPMLMLLQEWI